MEVLVELRRVEELIEVTRMEELAGLLGLEELVELIKLVGLEELEEKETDLLLLTELESRKLRILETEIAGIVEATREGSQGNLID